MTGPGTSLSAKEREYEEEWEVRGFSREEFVRFSKFTSTGDDGSGNFSMGWEFVKESGIHWEMTSPHPIKKGKSRYTVSAAFMREWIDDLGESDQRVIMSWYMSGLSPKAANLFRHFGMKANLIQFRISKLFPEGVKDGDLRLDHLQYFRDRGLSIPITKWNGRTERRLFRVHEKGKGIGNEMIQALLDKFTSGPAIVDLNRLLCIAQWIQDNDPSNSVELLSFASYMEEMGIRYEIYNPIMIHASETGTIDRLRPYGAVIMDHGNIANQVFDDVVTMFKESVPQEWVVAHLEEVSIDR